MNAAFGHLGLAMLDLDRDDRHARAALSIGNRIDARFIVSRVRQLLGGEAGDPTGELYFS